MGQLDACLPSWVIPVSIQLLGFHGLPTRLTHTKISGQLAGTSCWAPHSKPKEARKGSLWRLPNLQPEPLGAGGGWFDRCVAVTSSQYPMDPMAFHTLVTWCPTCRVQFVEQTLLESAIEPKSRLEWPTKTVAINCSWMMASPTWMHCPRCKTKWIKSLDEIKYCRSRIGQ